MLQLLMSYGTMMDSSLFLVRSWILDVKGVRDFAFTGSYSAIISERYDYIGTQVGVLIEFCLPRIFKKDLVSLFVCVIYFITIFIFVALINEVLFLFPDCFQVYVMMLIYF